MKNKNVTIGLALLISVAIPVYWGSVFLGILPINETVVGFKNWFMSFPLPDSWLGICSTLLVYYTYKENGKNIIIFSLLTASSLFFLALNGFMFGIYTGILFIPSIDEYIEIMIKVCSLLIGGYLIISINKLLIYKIKN